MIIEQLKAQAYDTLAQIQFLQEQLKQLNNQIAEAALAATTPNIPQQDASDGNNPQQVA